MFVSGYTIHKLNKVDSTNDEIKRWLDASEAGHGHIIIADQQTSGRGRSGKDWQSEDGNLFCSFAFNKETIHLDKKSVSQFPLAAAVALHMSLVDGADILFNIKWPNDIIVGDSKLAGILTEQYSCNESEFIIIGIGVNIISSPMIDNRKITSLKRLDITISKEQLLEKIAESFNEVLVLWKKHGFKYVQEYLQKNIYKQSSVSVYLNGELLIGAVRGIADDGALILEKDNDGSLQKISCGEVF